MVSLEIRHSPHWKMWINLALPNVLEAAKNCGAFRSFCSSLLGQEFQLGTDEQEASSVANEKHSQAASKTNA